MKNEKRFINKTYYESIVNAQDVPPVQSLAAMAANCTEENQLSLIRFAQGELYYDFADYEAAIFKWEQVQQPLLSWAQKNIGDAYLEMGLLPKAEEVYQSIVLDSETLTIEIAFQLFDLYVQQGRTSQAFQVIEKAVAASPDYPGLTVLARQFYEEQLDWKRAVQLAVDELIRTGQVGWTVILKKYAEEGHTLHYKPISFSDALRAAYQSDAVAFRQLAAALWTSYKQTASFKTWLHTINEVLRSSEVRACQEWDELFLFFEETFYDLLSGKYAAQEIRPLMSVYLDNWLFVSPAGTMQMHKAAAATVAWGELFPFTLPAALLERAKSVLQHMKTGFVEWENILEVLRLIQEWAEKHHFAAGEGLLWHIRHLTDHKLHFLLADGSKDAALLHATLDQRLTKEAVQTNVLICTEHDQMQMHVIEAAMLKPIPDLSVCEEALIEMKMPSRFMQQHNLSIIAAANWWEEETRRSICMSLADSILFLVDAKHGWSTADTVRLKTICAQDKIPVVFLLYGTTAFTAQEVEELKQNIRRHVHALVLDVHILTHHSYDIKQQIGDAAQLLRASLPQEHIQQNRGRSLLPVVHKTLYALAEKRREREEEIASQIAQNGRLLLQMEELEKQLTAFEREQLHGGRDSLEQIRQTVRRDAERHLPALLRGCADMLQADSDFGTIHLALNEAMNERIRMYMTETAVEKLQMQLQNWIGERLQRMQEQTATLEKVSKTIYALCGEECLDLAGYANMFEAWEQEALRLPHHIHVEEMNIFLRATPGQLLLKGAGKLLGGKQGSALLYSQYRRYIENEQYEDVVSYTVTALLEPFERFANLVEQQIEQYFGEPISALKRMHEDTHVSMQEHRNALGEIKAKPEVYEDPLLFFEVQLRQQEMLSRPRANQVKVI